MRAWFNAVEGHIPAGAQGSLGTPTSSPPTILNQHRTMSETKYHYLCRLALSWGRDDTPEGAALRALTNRPNSAAGPFKEEEVTMIKFPADATVGIDDMGTITSNSQDSEELNANEAGGCESWREFMLRVAHDSIETAYRILEPFDVEDRVVRKTRGDLSELADDLYDYIVR